MKTRTQIRYDVRLARLFADRQAGACSVKLSWVWLVLVILLLALPAQAADPVLVGQWPGWQRGTACGVAVKGHYAYMALEEAGMAVIDVSNQAKPRWVSCYGTSGWANDFAVSGNYACVADDNWGLQVLRLTVASYFDHPMRLTTQGFEVWLEVPVAGMYRVDRSADLNSWEIHITLTNISGRVSFQDQKATGFIQRYYLA
jgi:hypothetical protein